MKMKELCASERPREKMLSLGVGSMSNGELLAILLRTGNHGSSALELGQQLICCSEDSLCNLYNMGLSSMSTINGIGPGKAAAIMAALEIGRRFVLEESSVVKKPLVSARMVYDFMLPVLKGLRHEECWILLLNDCSYLTSKTRLTTGGGRSTVIDIRQVIKNALEKCASSIILIHNHPSGNPHPSKADIQQTDALHKAATSCGLNLTDHIIVCDDCFFSFAEDKVLK